MAPLRWTAVLLVCAGCASTPAASAPAGGAASPGPAKPPAHAAAVLPSVGGDPMAKQFEDKWCGEAHDPATPALQKSCDGGGADACRDLAKATFCGTNTTADPARALALLERACGLGSGLACNAVALMRAHGVHVERDPARAVRGLEAACAKKLEHTCQALATLLVDQDPTQVARPLAILQAECDRGQPEPCAFATSILIEDHADVPVDYATAHRYATRGCELGSQNACAQVALFLLTGQGTTQDEARGAEMAIASCDAGSALGCLNAGVAHLKGAGVPADRDKGTKLLDRACNLGNGSACRQLSELRAHRGESL